MSKTDLSTITVLALLYLVLEPFKWKRTIIKPALGPDDAPVYIQLSDEEAAPLILEGLVSGTDTALPPESEIESEFETDAATDTTNTHDDDATAITAAGQ